MLTIAFHFVSDNALRRSSIGFKRDARELTNSVGHNRQWLHKAFDSIDHTLSLKKLCLYGFPSTVSSWLRPYLDGEYTSSKVLIHQFFCMILSSAAPSSGSTKFLMCRPQIRFSVYMSSFYWAVGVNVAWDPILSPSKFKRDNLVAWLGDCFLRKINEENALDYRVVFSQSFPSDEMG